MSDAFRVKIVDSWGQLLSYESCSFFFDFEFSLAKVTKQISTTQDLTYNVNVVMILKNII